MDIVAYLRMLRRHWKLIVLATLVGGLLGAASTLATNSRDKQRTYYKATHTLFLDSSGIGEQVRPVYTNLDQIAVLVTTGDVPDRVASIIGGDGSEWSTHIFTVTNGTTNTLDITCATPEAQDSVACADSFAEQLIESLKDRELTRFNAERDETIKRVDDIQSQINQLDAQIAGRPPNLDLLTAQRNSLVNQYRLAYERFQQLADAGGPVSIVSTLESGEAQPIREAEYNTRLAQGRLGQNRVRADVNAPSDATALTVRTGGARFNGPVSRGILGAIIGFMIGIGLAVVSDRVDRKLRTREEVESAFGMPVLAEIPALTQGQQKDTVLLSATAPLSRTAEAYRAVRSSLMFQRATETRHRAPDDAFVILVTSPGPKEGKTTTSANLCAVFAEAGSRVLGINCDFRRPTLHKYLHLPNEPRKVFEAEYPGIWAITDVAPAASNANPALMVEEQRRIIASARKRFDVIVLDTAPLLTTNDATEVMDSADLVVVVSRSGVTTSDGGLRTRELLSRIAAPVSGVVLLGSEATPNDYYYYYSKSRAKNLAASESTPSAATSTRDHSLFEPAEPTESVSEETPPQTRRA